MLRKKYFSILVLVLGSACSRQVGNNGGVTHWACQGDDDCEIGMLCEEQLCVDVNDAGIFSGGAAAGEGGQGNGGTPASGAGETNGAGASIGGTVNTSPPTAGNDGSGGAADSIPTYESCPTALVSGETFHCALFQDGAVRCWGENSQGALGDGSLEDSLVPVDTGLSDIQFLAAGFGHACAAGADGVWCWGYSGGGELGVDLPPEGEIDNTERSLVPVSVPVGNEAPVGIFARDSITCLVDTFAHAYCWGSNDEWVTDVPRQITEVGNEPSLVVGLDPSTEQLSWVGLNGEVFRTDWSADVEGPFHVLGTPTRAIAGDCELKESGSVWCDGDWLGGVRLPRLPAPGELGENNGALATWNDQLCAVDRGGGLLCHKEGETYEVRALPSTIVTVGGSQVCGVSTEGAIWCQNNSKTPDDPPREVSRCSGTPTMVPETDVPLRASEWIEARAAEAQVACDCGACTGNTAIASEGCLDAFTDVGTDEDVTCQVDRAWELALAGCQDVDAPACPAHPAWSFCEGAEKTCPGSGTVISGRALCNGTDDCEDGFDELNCDEPTAFLCADATEVELSAICDGTEDCPDATDESFCNAVAP